jgi:cell division protein FtsW
MRLATTMLAFSTAALVSVGLVVMASSEIDFGLSSAAGRQVLWCGLGLLAAAGVALFDYRWLKRLSALLFVLSTALLVAVLVVGKEQNGATRWLSLGAGLTFQPSELAKLALIVLLAHYGERYQRFMPTFWKGLVVPGFLVGSTLVLVLLEPDRGTTVLLAAVSGGMLLVAGVRWLHLLPLGVVGVAGLGFLLLQDPVPLKRLESWINPEATREGAGYQVYQAQLAIASGGVTGRGLGSGEHYGYVPEVRTDFIFALVGEEMGLAGSVAVVVAFLVFLVASVGVAWHARDTFGLLLGSGAALLIGLQAFINLGVVTGVLPNKGLPLPFISKGGSSVFLMLVLVGVLFSVARTTLRERAEDEPMPELEELRAPQSS